MSAHSSRIRLYAPEDGGTPRDPSRIEALAPKAFLIRSHVREGDSILTHPVSRVDVACVNESDAAQEVSLHLDLSDDGRRTNRDDNVYGGMPLRDHLFVRHPGGDWRQVDGTVEGWILTVRLSLPPGETNLGLNPWYTYGDYLRLVAGLAHPHLRKACIGLSDGGREIWELTVTDFGAPDEGKRTLYWHTREHGYETFSSFAMEGLLGFLLSDEAGEARRRYRFVLHPMTNVDGVAEGCEYRGGYDMPTLRSTATGRLTVEAMDRLRPDVVVTWHNWIAPRDTDTLFFTDEQDGQATRRAWDCVTQRFPSPQAAGHRWESALDPNRNNWAGRELSDANLHQYAMKRYGTRVWGWELPWWRRTTATARRAGAAFAVALLATLELTARGSAALPEARPVDAACRKMYEFVLRGRCHVENPYRDAALIGEFFSPSGKTLIVEGFHDGGDLWKLRFTPGETGEWRYRLRGEGVEIFQEGTFRCVPSDARGFIRVHPEHPYAFAYQDGTPFFPMGDTCYGLYTDSPITPELRREYLETRRAQRFNFVRMGVLHSPTHWREDPNFMPWGGSAERPDFDRFNPAFFRGFDALLQEMDALGMNADLIVLNFYQFPFTDTSLWTAERERLWLRYLTARYAAFPNLFTWTLSNEYETHPDGAYRLDVPEDVEWVKRTARYIKAHDSYGHPVTTHPVISASSRSGRTDADFDPPWRIGEFYGEDDALDVLVQQTGQAGVWDEAQRCWTGDAPELAASLRADRKYGKPVLNMENGYEYLRGYPTGGNQVHHTDKVRRSSWRIVCSGGYFSAGFVSTLGHSDFWDRIDAPNRYPFLVRDEGAAGQLGILYDFMTALPFERMNPLDPVGGNALALATLEAGREVFVLYLPDGGAASLDLSDFEGAFHVRPFDPRTGAWGEAFSVEGGGVREFSAPEGEDAVFLTMR